MACDALYEPPSQQLAVKAFDMLALGGSSRRQTTSGRQRVKFKISRSPNFNSKVQRYLNIGRYGEVVCRVD